MRDSLSPEDILRQKEIEGGVKYDPPVDAPVTELEDNVYNESKDQSTEETQVIREQHPETTPDNSGVMDLGWKNLPVGITPSGGLFYPEGTKIAIRPAEVKEIRLFSTIDEDDMVDLDDKLNFILDSCCRIKFGSLGVVSYMDLKREDRFFVIMAIRDLTFVKGENRIIINTKDKCSNKDCKGVEAIELRTGVLSNYELDTKLMKYYSSDDRKFVFHIRKINKTVRMSVPSIGVSKKISEWISKQVKMGNDVDESFLKIAPYYFDDWRSLSDAAITEAMIDSNEWSKEEFSIYFQLADMIRIGTKLDIKIKCEVCSDGEVTAPIYFPGGFRSLFVISDIFGELLGS